MDNIHVIIIGLVAIWVANAAIYAMGKANIKMPLAFKAALYYLGTCVFAGLSLYAGMAGHGAAVAAFSILAAICLANSIANIIYLAQRNSHE